MDEFMVPSILPWMVAHGEPTVHVEKLHVEYADPFLTLDGAALTLELEVKLHEDSIYLGRDDDFGSVDYIVEMVAIGIDENDQLPEGSALQLDTPEEGLGPIQARIEVRFRLAVNLPPGLPGLRDEDLEVYRASVAFITGFEHARDFLAELTEMSTYAPLTVDDLAPPEWEDQGFEPLEIRRWMALGFDVGHASWWRRYWYDADSAALYRDLGAGADEAARWREVTEPGGPLSLEQVIEHISSGHAIEDVVSPDELSRIDDGREFHSDSMYDHDEYD